MLLLDIRSVIVLVTVALQWPIGLAADECATQKHVEHDEDVVSLLQLSNHKPVEATVSGKSKKVVHGKGKPPPDYYLNKYKGPGNSISNTKDHWASGLAEAFNIDENPGNVYNWGISVGMKWNDWWDGMMKSYPPAEDGYELLNYGMVTEPMHKCAKHVPPGRPGHSMPFNHTSAANMYANLAEESPTKLHNAEVLEISSGRGGGSALLSDCFCPKKMVGIDLGIEHVTYAQSRYGREGECPIEFQQADAMNLPFEDNSFDVIFNVQASHAYPSYRQFANEVHRVLRPGGTLLTADFRYKPGSDTDALILHNVFKKPLKSVNIKQHVIKSFDQNKLIAPFVDTCHVDFGLNTVNKVTSKVLTVFEPFAPLSPLIQQIMKKSAYPGSTGGYAGIIPKLKLPGNIPGTAPSSLLQKPNKKELQELMGLQRPKHYFKDVYNTPADHLHTAEMDQVNKISKVRHKVRNFFRDMHNGMFHNASSMNANNVSMAARPAKPLPPSVHGVPTPISCVNQAGIVVDDGLRHDHMDYRMYITQK